MKKIYNLTIEPLTAVHVGSGNVLTPLEYKIAKTSSGAYKYVRFSSDSIMRRIATDEKLRGEFERFSLNNDMKSLQQFFHQNMKNGDVSYLCVPTKNFEEKYAVNKNKDPLENASEVFEMYRAAEKTLPAIPGSSIKGAIRTALVDSCAQNAENFDLESAKKDKHDKTGSKTEKLILGNKNAKDDPFRAVQIGDCNFQNPLVQGVGTLQIIKRNRSELSEANSTQLQAEVILGKLASKDSRPQEFKVAIDEDLQKAGQVSKSFSMEKIISECNYFYSSAFDLEYQTFYEDADSDKLDLVEKLKSQIEEIKTKKNQFLIRLGRWSQKESVTLYDENADFEKSRTVFDLDGQYLPLGWCICTVKDL